MTDLQVIDLAREVAGVFGVKIDERLILSGIHLRRAIAPIAIISPLVTIWIDRQYIKLCEHDDLDVVYIYVTKQYAKEELRRTMELLSEVGSQNEFIMCSGITRQLRRALTFMEENRSDYYVFSDEIPW